MTLPEDNNQIFASKYETVLPSKEELQKLLEDKNFKKRVDECSIECFVVRYDLYFVTFSKQIVKSLI